MHGMFVRQVRNIALFTLIAFMASHIGVPYMMPSASEQEREAEANVFEVITISGQGQDDVSHTRAALRSNGAIEDVTTNQAVSNEASVTAIPLSEAFSLAQATIATTPIDLETQTAISITVRARWRLELDHQVDQRMYDPESPHFASTDGELSRRSQSNRAISTKGLNRRTSYESA